MDGRGSHLNPWVLAMFTVLFALVAGLGWWALNQRRRVVVPVTSRAAFEAQQRLGAERALLAQTVSRADFERLSAHVQKLDAEHRALNDWVRADFQGRQTAAAVAAVPAAVPAAPALAPVEAAAQAFADWCRQGTPMMSRVEFFSADLGGRVPGATARAVYRDLNSQAEPVRFDAAGGASPAEFWLVTAGGEALVFPQPLNAHQFRDLTRIFDGTAAPASLGSVAPARVRDEGATFALVTPGRVS